MNDTELDSTRILFRWLSWLTLCPAAVCLNGLVIGLSFAKELKGQRFRLLLANLATAELAYALYLLVGYLCLPQGQTECAVQGTLSSILSTSPLYGPMTVILSRYLLLVRKWKSIPLKWEIFFNTYYHLFGIIVQVLLTATGQVIRDRVPGIDWCSIKQTSRLYNIVALAYFFLPYAILLFCSVHMWKVMKQMESVQRNLAATNEAVKKKLRDTRILLRNGYIQISVPLIFQLGLMVALGSGLGSNLLRDVNVSLFNGTTIVDPVSTIVIVKPYKRALIRLLNKIGWVKNNAVEAAPF